MKNFVAVVCLCGVAGMAMAQTAREEIRQNPALAAGKYYAYQAPEVTLTSAPDGYEPFYISAFARHGSRYLTKEKKYTEPLGICGMPMRQVFLRPMENVRWRLCPVWPRKQKTNTVN